VEAVAAPDGPSAGELLGAYEPVEEEPEEDRATLCGDPPDPDEPLDTGGSVTTTVRWTVRHTMVVGVVVGTRRRAPATTGRRADAVDAVFVAAPLVTEQAPNAPTIPRSAPAPAPVTAIRAPAAL
jgi:hypothetical protein